MKNIKAKVAALAAAVTDPSLHIIVNRGHVTLESVVANKLDNRLAYLAANQVSGVFSVTNNLRVERED